jgi:UDP-2,4-diacetamido-2,4,6-trideoxy-beta-L-altropyranose hydrolase
MKIKGQIFFRADGNTNIGLGHITRSLALAAMLKDNFEIVFIVQNPSEPIREQLSEVASTIIELLETTDYIKEANFIAQNHLHGNEIVVLDGYNFQTEYQKIIKNKGVKLVCIDDLHAWHFVADVVINHAGGVKKSDYSCESYTKLCLGLDYALLRKPFLEAAKQERKIDKIENLFICFGGSDSLNLTQKTIEVCIEIPTFHEIHVVVGSAYEHYEKLRNFAKGYSTIKVYQNLDAEKMCKVMLKCHAAIVPASGIAIECLALGMYLITGYYAENQFYFHQYFVDNNFKTLGNFAQISKNDFVRILLSFCTHGLGNKQIKRISQTEITQIFDTINI